MSASATSYTLHIRPGATSSSSRTVCSSTSSSCGWLPCKPHQHIPGFWISYKVVCSSASQKIFWYNVQQLGLPTTMSSLQISCPWWHQKSTNWIVPPDLVSDQCPTNKKRCSDGHERSDQKFPVLVNLYTTGIRWSRKSSYLVLYQHASHTSDLASIFIDSISSGSKMGNAPLKLQ